MTPSPEAWAVETLAKRLAVAWWSAEGILNREPAAKSANWFCTENVEHVWEQLADTSRFTNQRAFFESMAALLLPSHAAALAAARAEGLGPALTNSMDNVLASKLGEIARAAMTGQRVGDSIDRGLILRRLLAEGGFELRAAARASELGP